MKRTRTLLTRSTALSVIVVLVLGGATAAACNEPRGYGGPAIGGPPSYGPHDPVPFRITGTEAGAEYYVSVSGSNVLRGTDSDGGGVTDGSFTMPDLGSSPRTVELRFDVAHEAAGEYFPSTQTLRYEPPAPPAPPPPATEQPPPAQEAISAGGQRQPDPTPVRQDSDFAPGATQGGSEAADQTAAPRPAASARTQAQAPATAPAETADAAAPPPAQAAVAPRRHAARVGMSAAERMTAQPPQVLPRTADEQRSGGLISGQTELGPVAVPTVGLALTGLIFALGTLGLAAVFYVAGRVAPSPEQIAVSVGEALDADAIEEELQRMIREEARAPSSVG